MKRKIFIFSLALFLCSFNLALATETSLVPLGNQSEKTAYDTGNYTINDFVQTGVNITKIILGVIGSLALLMFVYGGVTMLVSSGNSDQVSKAKGIIMAAVVGLAIVFVSYIIVKFVIGALGGDSAMTGTWGNTGIDISR